MAVNGHASLLTRDTLAGSPETPFVIPSLLGERIYIPCSKSVMRLLVTGNPGRQGRVTNSYYLKFDSRVGSVGDHRTAVRQRQGNDSSIGFPTCRISRRRFCFLRDACMSLLD